MPFYLDTAFAKHQQAQINKWMPEFRKIVFSWNRSVEVAWGIPDLMECPPDTSVDIRLTLPSATQAHG